MSGLVSKDLKNFLDVVIFDMDQTILSLHTRGAVYQTKPEGSRSLCVEDLNSYVVPVFKELVPSLVESGITGKDDDVNRKVRNKN